MPIFHRFVVSSFIAVVIAYSMAPWCFPRALRQGFTALGAFYLLSAFLCSVLLVHHRLTLRRIARRAPSAWPFGPARAARS